MTKVSSEKIFCKMTGFLILAFSFVLTSCGSFKAERVDAAKSDEKAMEITDKWVSGDTDRAIQEAIKNIQNHKGLQRYLGQYQGQPKIFIGEVQNSTAEAYFPIDDLNDKLLNELSSTGDFILVDAAARSKILKEITYQNDGMVDPSTAKSIGKQTGADIMIFGTIYMKPETRDGKTIKEYSLNLRMTDIEKGVEVLRTRAQIYKYSEQKSSGW
jgi:uncharacterized protein (TIGR02722 family)